MNTCTLPVLEMSCAVCAANVENKVKSLPGVIRASVNFAANTLQLEYDPEKIGLEQVRDAIRSIGYDLIIAPDNKEELQEEAGKVRYKSLRRKVIWAWALCIPLMAVSMIFMHEKWSPWIMLAILCPCLETGFAQDRQHGHISDLEYFHRISIQSFQYVIPFFLDKPGHRAACILRSGGDDHCIRPAGETIGRKG